MAEYVVGIGSNCGDSDLRVAVAIQFLESLLSEFRHSDIYRTPSTKADGTYYSNAVASGHSHLTPQEMAAVCKEYERREGREKSAGAPVVIDLDVVMADGEVLRPRDMAQSYFIIGFNQLR